MASETIRPDADVAIGSWTDDGGGTTNIHDAIDEATAVDTDYIKTENNPTSSSCEIGFGAVSDETPMHGRLSYRYRKQGGRTADLTVQLKMGTQVVQEWSHAALGTSWVQADQVIMAEISDWSDIRVVFIGNQSSGGSTTTVEVSWSEITTAVVKTIASSGGDYSTIANWNTNLDNTTYPTALTVAEGHGADESFTITAQNTVNPGTNIIGVVLTSTPAARHTAVSGTGFRITSSTNLVSFFKNVVGGTLGIFWTEMSSTATWVTAAYQMRAGLECHMARCLLHGFDKGAAGNNPMVIDLTFQSGGGDNYAHNNFIWSCRSDTDPMTGIYAQNSSNETYYIYNNTLFDINTDGGTLDADGFRGNTSARSTEFKNNLVLGTAATGTATDCNYGADHVASNNGSDDASADDIDAAANHEINLTPSTELTSTSPADLRLDSGATVIGEGVDLGGTPTGGAYLAIQGRNRVAEGDTWDIGADQFVAADERVVAHYRKRIRALNPVHRGMFP